MAKAAFLTKNEQTGIVPIAGSSDTVAGLGWDKLIDPQPRHRARVAATAATIFIDLGAAKAIDCAALISTSLGPGANAILRADSSTTYPTSNLLLQSNTFTNAVWTKSNSVISATGQPDYDLNNTASLLDENTNDAQHSVAQSLAGLSDNTTLNVAFFVKPNERNWCRVAFVDKSGAQTYANFDAATGTVGLTNSTHVQ